MLHLSVRWESWDYNLLDFAWLLGIVGGPIVRYEPWNGRELDGEQPDGAIVRICAHGRDIGENHYDAVAIAKSAES